MPSTPRPWDGYDDADEDDLLALLDGRSTAPPTTPTTLRSTERAARASPRRSPSHEAIKKDAATPATTTPRLHDRASAIAGAWQP